MARKMKKCKVEKVKIGIGTKKTFAFGKKRMFVYDVVVGKQFISRHPTKGSAIFDCKQIRKR